MPGAHDRLLQEIVCIKGGYTSSLSRQFMLEKKAVGRDAGHLLHKLCIVQDRQLSLNWIYY